MTPAATTPSANGQPVNPAGAYTIIDPDHSYTLPDQAPAAATGAAAAAAPATSPAPKHPAWVLQHAAEFGIHPLVIDRLPTGELSQLVMETMARARQEQATRGVANAIQTPQAAAAAAQPQPVAPSFDWGVHDDTDDSGRTIRKQFTDADVHPAVAVHIKSQNDRIKRLEDSLQNMHQSAAVSVEQQRQGQFDVAFNKIGGVFGTGTANSLKGTAEFGRRGSVYAAVKGMYNALPAEVREGMTIEQAVFTMAKSMFGAEVPAAAANAARPTNGQPTAEQFRNGTVQPPTQRRGSDQQFGPARAKEEAVAWFAEQQAAGAIPANGGTSMDEFLPM